MLIRLVRPMVTITRGAVTLSENDAMVKIMIQFKCKDEKYKRGKTK